VKQGRDDWKLRTAIEKAVDVEFAALLKDSTALRPLLWDPTLWDVWWRLEVALAIVASICKDFAQDEPDIKRVTNYTYQYATKLALRDWAADQGYGFDWDKSEMMRPD
jgi:hypothetical protein